MTVETRGSLRLVHYLNAFFGGVGGEAEAHYAVETCTGPLGPGNLLQQLCAGQAEVVGTVVCGDGYFNEHEEAVVERVRQYVRDRAADAFIAGPAFGSGRYGLACGRLCVEMERLGIPAITGLHGENPGGEVFLPQHIFAVNTSASAAGMREALERMSGLLLKRVCGEPIGSAAEEGFLPRDVRRTVETGVPAAKRAVDLALRKLKGEPYSSEITIETFEPVLPPPPLAHPGNTLFALVTECGLVPKGILTVSPPPGRPIGGRMKSPGCRPWHAATGRLCTAAMTTPRRCWIRIVSFPWTPCEPCTAKDVSAVSWTTCWSPSAIWPA